MPERVRIQHPTRPDWQYEEWSDENGYFHRHGFRADTPAALPLIRVSARTAISVSQRFAIEAQEFDRQAGKTHHIMRPSRFRS
jgi:hypothetical protein